MSCVCAHAHTLTHTGMDIFLHEVERNYLKTQYRRYSDPTENTAGEKETIDFNLEDAPNRVGDVLWKRDLNHKGESVHC